MHWFYYRNEQLVAEIRVQNNELAMFRLSEKENKYEIKTKSTTIEKLTGKSLYIYG